MQIAAQRATYAIQISKNMAYMANSENNDDLPSMKGVIEYLRQNILDSAKAHELRTKDVNAIIKGCESGKLSVEAALEQHERVSDRWGGESLPGTSASPHLSDEQIIQKIDEVRAKQQHAALKRAIRSRDQLSR